MNREVQNRLYLLDALRGICAALVALRHESPLWGFELFRTHLAVDLFFLMSGFVIAASYGAQLRSGQLTLGRFMVIRLIRFVPVYWLSLAVVIALRNTCCDGAVGGVPLASVEGVGLILREALLIPNLTPDQSLFLLNGVAWTLMFELLLNVVYAAATRYLPVPALWFITLAFGLVTACLTLWYGTADRGFVAQDTALALGASRAGFGIFLGALLASHAAQLRTLALGRINGWLALALAVLALLIPSFGERLDGWIDAVCILVIFPALLWPMAAHAPTGFINRWCHWLGASSYPMYLLHSPFTSFVMFAAPSFFPAIHHAAIASLFLLGFCVALDRFFDTPVRRYLRQQTQPQAPLAAS